MQTLWIALFSFMLLCAFEIRHRLIVEDIKDLKGKLEILTDETRRLREELKTKKNALENFTPPQA